MKRKMCLVLAGLMVAGLAGCGADQKDPQQMEMKRWR